MTVAARQEGELLVLEVRDDGPGARGPASPRGTGLGLDLVRRRLAARFGDRATLEIRTSPGSEGWHVVIRCPRLIGASPLAPGASPRELAS